MSMCRSRLVLEKHFGAVGSLKSFPQSVNMQHSSRSSAGGSCLVSGGRDGMLHVWDCGTGICTQAVSAHRGNVTSLGSCGLVNGKPCFYSAGSDGFLKLWNLGGSGGSNSRTASQLVCSSDLFLGYHCKAVYSDVHSGIFCSSISSNCTQLWTTNGSADNSVVRKVPTFKFQQQPISVGSPLEKCGMGDVKPTCINTWTSTDLPSVTDSGMATDMKNACTDTIAISCNMSNKHYVALSYKSGDIVRYE